ncbi:hypothetical protein DSM106972_038790 [Dulcicalothrix desertica PCC 7102]|uniref:Uncharacterized protein n=1 Tax=Dulcicalothrix desertica PCC 7102 TaxID=232991 RepID=A0A433VG41_9CYAN|nr:hypothetical protein [Dulcicalothrix desertica]RUT05058.1 hypothetical protein DSM106972_038790 [Dulcicalothrix desertica PCC 7102]TWH62599.1 hypothetical protein CAL7102_00092 [Dulcicalothrix desertica PCC 7102]
MKATQKGLIVLIPYSTGQDYDSENEYDFWDSHKHGSVEYSSERKGNFNAKFEPDFLNKDYLNTKQYEEDYDYRCDDCSAPFEFPKVLLNPNTGKLQWAILSFVGNSGQWIVTPNEDNSTQFAYLPVFVDTDRTIIALRAVSNENISGSKPLVEEAFEIPDPGDCFCYANQDEYDVLTIEQMIDSLESNTSQYILPVFDDMGDSDDMWKQFKDWCKRRLNYKLKYKKK